MPAAAEPTATPPPLPRKGFWLDWKGTVAICAVLLAMFATMSFTAAASKSATWDEPLHVLGGYVHKWLKDYRVNFEDPALFGMWAAAPLGDAAIRVDTRHQAWQAIPGNTDQQFVFTIFTLYRLPENWPDSTINVCRSQFMLVGVALGALAAWWSWKLAGAVGALATCTLFALDPNLTAHASIVKNDVATGLLMLGLGYSMWQFGRTGSIWRFIIVALVCAAAVNTKFSGVLFGPVAVMLLIARAIMTRWQPWRVAGMPLRNVVDKIAAVLVMVVLIGATTWVMTWAVYGFRFAPMRDGGLMDMKFRMDFARVQELRAQIEKREGRMRQPTQAEFDAHKGGIVPRMAMALNDYRLLPQAWLYGFTYTYSMTQVRSTFLLGETRTIGWASYFPLAMLFKTPLATLLAIAGALALSILRTFSPRMQAMAAASASHGASQGEAPPPKLDLWTILCLTTPPLVYALAAITSNLNLGLRHILPVYSFIFIGVGAMVAVAIKLLPKPSKFVVAGLALLLAIESLPTWPNYIPFFNTPSRMVGKLKLLSDSNLDWGQDLKALGKWREAHKDKPLYVCYFGLADPKFYISDFTDLVGSWLPLEPQANLSDLKQPGYVAISATNLQGVYIQGDVYKEFRDRTPIKVINETIYIYDWSPSSGEGK